MSDVRERKCTCEHSAEDVQQIRKKSFFSLGRRKKSSKLKDDKISTEATEIEIEELDFTLETRAHSVSPISSGIGTYSSLKKNSLETTVQAAEMSIGGEESKSSSLSSILQPDPEDSNLGDKDDYSYHSNSSRPHSPVPSSHSSHPPSHPTSSTPPSPIQQRSVSLSSFSSSSSDEDIQVLEDIPSSPSPTPPRSVDKKYSTLRSIKSLKSSLSFRDPSGKFKLFSKSSSQEKKSKPDTLETQKQEKTDIESRNSDDYDSEDDSFEDTDDDYRDDHDKNKNNDDNESDDDDYDDDEHKVVHKDEYKDERESSSQDDDFDSDEALDDFETYSKVTRIKPKASSSFNSTDKSTRSDSRSSNTRSRSNSDKRTRVDSRLSDKETQEYSRISEYKARKDSNKRTIEGSRLSDTRRYLDKNTRPDSRLSSQGSRSGSESRTKVNHRKTRSELESRTRPDYDQRSGSDRRSKSDHNQTRAETERLTREDYEYTRSGSRTRSGSEIKTRLDSRAIDVYQTLPGSTERQDFNKRSKLSKSNYSQEKLSSEDLAPVVTKEPERKDVWRERKIIIDEQTELNSDHGLKEDDLPETEIKSETFGVGRLKSTFSSVLGRISRQKSTGSESSPVSKSLSGTLERKFKTVSNVSLNQTILDFPRKKTFIFFSKQGDQGINVKDDDDLNVPLKGEKKLKKSGHISIREKFDSLTGTLRRKKKKKSKVEETIYSWRIEIEEIPMFVWVNKPWFSSVESMQSIDSQHLEDASKSVQQQQQQNDKKQKQKNELSSSKNQNQRKPSKQKSENKSENSRPSSVNRSKRRHNSETYSQHPNRIEEVEKLSHRTRSLGKSSLGPQRMRIEDPREDYLDFAAVQKKEKNNKIGNGKNKNRNK